MTLINLTKFSTRAYRENEGDVVATVPVTINTDAIRCFYPRRDDMPGTRITFKDGGGFPVAESYEDIKRFFVDGTQPTVREPLRAVAPQGEDEGDVGETSTY